MDTFQIVAINASTLGSSIRHGNFLYPCILIYFHCDEQRSTGLGRILLEFHIYKLNMIIAQETLEKY